MNPGKEEEKEGGDVAGQVAERYRRVLSFCCVDVFRWNISGERIVCLGLYINSKTITLTWLTPEICERHLLAPPQIHTYIHTGEANIKRVWWSSWPGLSLRRRRGPMPPFVRFRRDS